MGSIALRGTHSRQLTKSHRGAITTQESRLLRWALVEGVSRYHGGSVLAAK